METEDDWIDAAARPTATGSRSSWRPTRSRRTGPTRPTRSSSTSTCGCPTSTRPRRRPRSWARPGSAAARPGTRWPTRPATRSTCAERDDPATTIYAVTLDCARPGGLARFYADLLGMELRYEADEGSLIGADDQGQLMFQKVGDYNPPQWPDPAHPQQFHLDLACRPTTRPSRRCSRSGPPGCPAAGRHFRVYADPAGHPFCLIW